MPESIDDHVVRRLRGWPARPGAPTSVPDPETLLAYFDAQLQSRHLDLAIRWLQTQGEAFYTIGSAGHESNAAVAMALRPSDPALLHYRSGGFYAARAGQVAGSTAIDDVLNGALASTSDPISGGRHKVFGNAALNVIPQTSTIGSHLPRAFGLAFALGRAPRSEVVPPWPLDSVVVCSFGDASANHSTAVGALNASAYCAHQGAPLPILYVCEDNGIGISTKSPAGWVERSLSSWPGIDYAAADGTDPVELLATAARLADRVRAERRPAILHLRTVRFMGHAGSDAEIAYRSQREIEDDYARDPVLATAGVLIDAGVLTPESALARYDDARATVMQRAKALAGARRLDDPELIAEPITARRARRDMLATAERRQAVFGGRLPEDEGPLSLAQSVNAALKDALAAHPEALVFGEDIGRKGGVYGVTRGLRKAYGANRVFDTLLDEQTILGTALGSALAGFLPIPEIQYLAYLHNAEDQLRGEAATLRFFSNGQYQNGMVVRVAGLAYQKGFGGHFHNDNSVAVLRDIPGLILAVPSHPANAPQLLRECLALAGEGRVCVYLEPIALYHQRDLQDGDGAWTGAYTPPAAWPAESSAELGRVRTYGEGRDVLLVTFGNGVRLSLRAAAELAPTIACTVLDLQWLSPLPHEELLRTAAGFDRVVVVDETRRSGGVSESIITALVDGGHTGRIVRVTSADSFIPLGPAADHVLLSEGLISEVVRRIVD
ncbi:thiamine pyrophosphate-dependent enzyme [Aeromicrobium ginsengisoli]|uniref:MFS transporter n=1 Tax=Aeromicrobium ginsengisoli TaxID=363867 RepID=A0A5M4FE39_9ACTN|nr:thiamine pyrophosphate-dependent enzyme [Aeromicrobium ginsengisoli]KAA1397499.1 MFS transporter [Aeromicrobium ginsengisoli]